MEELIAVAKTMVINYADDVAKQNLDGILAALSDDVHFQMHDKISFEGKPMVRDFYEKSFAEGDLEFSHEFTNEKAVSDVIFISGKQNKKLTPTGQKAENYTYDFSFILKKVEGELKIWQLRVV